MNSNLVIFKGLSKKGNIYYSFKLTTIIEGVLLESNGFLYEDTALFLQSKGVKLVDMTIKK